MLKVTIMVQDLIQIGIDRKLIVIDQNNNRIEYPYNGKNYVWSDPEEKVRARVYIELIIKYKYSPFKMGLEVAVPRRTPSDWADIVVFKEDGRTPYIVVETKRKDISNSEINRGIEEGFGNANSLRSKFMLFDCRQVRRAYNVMGFPSTERIKNMIPDIPINYGQVPEYKYKRNDPNWDLRAVDFNSLAKIFQHCHNSLWSGGKRDPASAFDEMSKILFAKIYD